MSIVATGMCEDCDKSVSIDFDEDNGAPYCEECGGYEVSEVETDEVDDEVEGLILFDSEDEYLDDEDDEDGIVVDDEF